MPFKKAVLIFLILFVCSKLTAQNSFEGIIKYSLHTSTQDSGRLQVFFKKNKLRLTGQSSNNGSWDMIFDLEKNLSYEIKPGDTVLISMIFDPAIENLFPLLKKDSYKKQEQILGKECTAYTLDSSKKQRGSAHAIYVINGVTSWFADSLLFTIPDSAVENSQIGGLCNGKQISLSIHGEFIPSMLFDIEANDIIERSLPDSVFAYPADCTLISTYPMEEMKIKNIHLDEVKDPGSPSPPPPPNPVKKKPGN